MFTGKWFWIVSSTGGVDKVRIRVTKRKTYGINVIKVYGSHVLKTNDSIHTSNSPPHR